MPRMPLPLCSGGYSETLRKFPPHPQLIHKLSQEAWHIHEELHVGQAVSASKKLGGVSSQESYCVSSSGRLSWLMSSTWSDHVSKSTSFWGLGTLPENGRRPLEPWLGVEEASLLITCSMIIFWTSRGLYTSLSNASWETGWVGLETVLHPFTLEVVSATTSSNSLFFAACLHSRGVHLLSSGSFVDVRKVWVRLSLTTEQFYRHHLHAT